MKNLIGKLLIVVFMYLLTVSMAHGVDNVTLMNGEDGVIDTCLGDLNEDGMTENESALQETNALLQEAEEQDPADTEEEDSADTEEEEFEVADPVAITVAQALEMNMMAAEQNYEQAMSNLSVSVSQYVDMIEYRQYCYDTYLMYAQMVQEMEQETPNSPFLQETINERQYWVDQYFEVINNELPFLESIMNNLQAVANQRLQEYEQAQQLYFDYMAAHEPII